jgi:hypothetical protein
MGSGWPNNHRVQILTITTNTLDCSHSCALDSGTSVVSHVILTYKDFDRACSIHLWVAHGLGALSEIKFTEIKFTYP